MEVLSIVSIVFGIIGVIVAIVVFFRNRQKDSINDGEKTGAVMTELGYIKSGVDDIKRRQEKQEQQHLEVISRIVAVEESTKQAHKRIDRLEREVHHDT